MCLKGYLIYSRDTKGKSKTALRFQTGGEIRHPQPFFRGEKVRNRMSASVCGAGKNLKSISHRGGLGGKICFKSFMPPFNQNLVLSPLTKWFTAAYQCPPSVVILCLEKKRKKNKCHVHCCPHIFFKSIHIFPDLDFDLRVVVYKGQEIDFYAVGR